LPDEPASPSANRTEGKARGPFLAEQSVEDPTECQGGQATADGASGRQDRELRALKRAASAVLRQQGFADAARAIFDLCRDVTGASSGYVALLDEDGSENEVLFLESGGLQCDVNPELPMPIRGLRATAYQNCEAAYENDFMHSKWVQFMPQGHVILTNVLFAPLVVNGKAVGLIGLANKGTDFTEDDKHTATSFGELAAIALQNSEALDQRDRAEREKEQTIERLETALKQVRTLSGLLPICASCKQIRDDKGYWNQIESYISKHADVDFSHGICPACADRLYPGLA